jgi:precorrin-6B methylase 2
MSSAGKPIEAIRAFHAGSFNDDMALARILRITPSSEKRSGELPMLLRRFGNQNFEFAAMSFRELREVFRAVELGPDDRFCDAGAGYGHAVFYGAGVAKCRFRAIEILPVRCASIRRIAARLGLTNVEVIQGDALVQNYADVTYVFVNNPFFPEAAARFVRHLKTARRRRLTVIAAHNIVDAFRGDPDFVEVDTAADLPDYCFGVFRWKRQPTARRGRPATPTGSAPSPPG